MRASHFQILFCALIAFSIILFKPFSSYADYHYASHTGSNTYPYTSWETAADSIQKAINSASAGDTIYVGNGVWSDMPCTLGPGISLIGMGIDSTVISRVPYPPGYRYLWLYGENTIEGFTFDGVNQSNPIIAVEAHLEVTGLTIKNNKFTNLNLGLNFGGNTGEIINNIFLSSGAGIDASFERCSFIVRNNLLQGISELMLTGDAAHWTVTNNIFCNSPDANWVIGMYCSPNHPADSAYIANNLIYLNQAQANLQIKAIGVTPPSICENNTVVGSPQYGDQEGISFWGYGDLRPLITRNNAIASYHAAFGAYDSATVRASYTDIWNTTLDSTGDGTGHVQFYDGMLHQNPMFNNPDSGDFRLQLYSPLIDAGDPNILDYDGSRSDIGTFGGPGGYFYEYQDLSPQTPDSLSYSIVGDSIILHWRMSTEADFYRYMINRDTIPNFSPWAGNIIGEPDTSLFIDTHWDRFHNYYYKIAAYDNQLNLSPYSEELTVLITSISGPLDPNIPQMTEISTNYPNPFNNNTIIKYSLADLGYQPADVKLYVYNISGQLVRRLVDTREYPGIHEIIWDGRGEGGEALSSGIYFTRLIVSGIELQRARKITLLK